MSLYDAIRQELPNLRQQAESRMASRCTVRRTTGETTTNTEGWEVPEWAVTYSELPIRLGGSGSTGTRNVTVGETEVQVALRVAHLPAATDDLRDGDLIEITEGESAGMVLQVVEASWQDQATARRVPVVEVTRPEEWA